MDTLVPQLQKMGKKLVWGEGNALSCGGKEEVSDSFAAALWALDNLFETAVRGVYKVSAHNFRTLSTRTQSSVLLLYSPLLSLFAVSVHGDDPQDLLKTKHFAPFPRVPSFPPSRLTYTLPNLPSSSF